MSLMSCIGFGQWLDKLEARSFDYGLWAKEIQFRREISLNRTFNFAKRAPILSRFLDLDVHSSFKVLKALAACLKAADSIVDVDEDEMQWWMVADELPINLHRWR